MRPGDVIAGKFRVERVIGEGGMGYVVAAQHLQLGQMVALKFIREDACTPHYRGRFLREARNTVRLKSKHVARVLDVGSLKSGAPYMVMEYLDGTDLSALLHSRGPFPVEEVAEYVIQACEALAEAHGHNIVHRDLKPANLFLTQGPGGEAVVKVLDFGVSKVLELGDDATRPGGRPRSGQIDSVVTRVTDLLGSPSYMAPEQVVSARDANAKSDVWSLGVILFRLVSGKAPFTGASLGELIQSITKGPLPDLRAIKPELPAGFEDVVAGCLERDRSKRLDVTELARRLAPYAGPVASPSLERIALLGPALVTGAGGSTPPQVSTANAWSKSPAQSGRSSGSKAPAPPPRSRWIWGTALFLTVLCAAFLTVTLASKVFQSPSVQPPPPVVPKAAPSGTEVIGHAVEPPASQPTSADAGPVTTPPPHGRPRRRPGQRPKPLTAAPSAEVPAASSAPAGKEIPATRE